LISLKRVEVNLFGRLGYAYVAIDHARREDEVFKYAKTALDSKDVSREEMNANIKTKGLFILISLEEMLLLRYGKEIKPALYWHHKQHIENRI
jgi:hypothetical protein